MNVRYFNKEDSVVSFEVECDKEEQVLLIMKILGVKDQQPSPNQRFLLKEKIVQKKKPFVYETPTRKY